MVLFGGPGENRCENIPYDSVVVFRLLSEDLTADVLNGKLQVRANDGLVRVDENGTHFIMNVTEDQTLSLYHRVIWMNGDSVIRTDYVKHGLAPVAPSVSGLTGWTKGGQQVDIANECITSSVTYAAIVSHSQHGGSGVQETVVVNLDGSITRTISITTPGTDGSTIEDISETTTMDGEVIREKDIEKVRDRDGSVTVTYTDMQYLDGGKVTTGGKTFPDGNGYEVQWFGDDDYEQMSNKVVIECHQEITREQDRYVCDLIGRIIGQKLSPEVVIITDSARGVSASIIGMIVSGNGSLTFIQDGNELRFSAAALEGLGENGADSISIVLTRDIPKMLDPRIMSAYDIRVLIDGEAYHTPYAEPLRVSVPYTLGSGQDASKITVYYLGEELERIDSVYLDGYVVFDIAHTSLYSVVYAEDGGSPAGPSASFDALTIIAAVSVALVIVAVAAVALKRKV